MINVIGVRMVMSVFGCVFYGCVCCVCVYKGLLEVLIIDGVFHPISHAHLTDQTYESSEFIHNCSLQGQWF